MGVHGIIEYDSGPGTEKKTYVHINASIENEIVLSSVVVSPNKKQGFDALILKLPPLHCVNERP